MTLLLFSPLDTAGLVASHFGGTCASAAGSWPATVGGPWPAAVLAEMMTADHAMLGAVAVSIGTLLALLAKWRSERKSIVEEAVAATLAKAHPPEHHIAGQPIKIEHVAQFVSVEHFNSKFNEIALRFVNIEAQIKDQVTKTDKYMHEMRHEMRGELQAIKLAAQENMETAIGSVSKVHTRVDTVAESLGEVRGELRHVVEGLKSITALLLQQGGKGV
jgi:hypothetical protein